MVEVLLLGLVLLVPILWLISVLSAVHAAALATTTAARESGFEAVRAPDAIAADRSMQPLIAGAAADHGLDPDLVDVSWRALEGWKRGGQIEVVVSYQVPVFQVPLLGEIAEPSIEVTARHVAMIDRYRSRPQ